MAHRTPVVEQGVLVLESGDGPTGIVVDTPAWFAWLASATTFRFVGAEGPFTARQERPSHGRGSRYWKAYRRLGAKLYRLYLGPSDGLTLEQLRRTAAALADREQPGATNGPRARVGSPEGPASPRVGRLPAAERGSRRRPEAVSGSVRRVDSESPSISRVGDTAGEATLEAPVAHLRLLGDFALLCGDEPVTQLASVRLQSLLAYLTLHRNAPHPRQHLAFLFWPDATEQQARNSLRQLVHQLRRVWATVDRYLTADASTLSWRGVLVHSDVAEFEDALSRADEAVRRADTAAERAALEEAVGVYRGDLLPSCYDDWLASEREQLNQRFSRTLDRLIDVLEGRREYRAAIDYAQRRLRHDQLEEEAYRRLMHLHALNHDRASALRVYHACASMLEQELAVEPSPATREAYEGLVRLAAMPAPALGPALESAPPLVGRQGEWTQLRAAWQRAVSGEAHLVVITGEAGIGKSRLADELYVWAARQGIATAQTRAYAAEGRLSYAPVTDWLRSECVQPALVRLDAAWQSELARLLPELVSRQADLQNTGTAGPQRQRLFEALARAVLSADQPLLLRLDDLQWCDQDTLEWLHYLLRFDPRARLLVVGTARTEEIEAGHALAALLLNLRGAGQLHEIALGPLDGAETAELAAHSAGRELDPDQARHVYRETEGNPLFVVEAARAALGDRREPSAMVGRRTPDSLPLDPQRLPPKVHAVIAARLAQLSDSTRKLAGLAATIGRAFTLDVLARAHDGDEESLVSGVDELWRRRIVREHGTNAYDFAHDKIREVAYAEVTPARRPGLHRRVAEALEQAHAADLDAVSAQLAAHYEQAGLSDRAVAYYQSRRRLCNASTPTNRSSASFAGRSRCSRRSRRARRETSANCPCKQPLACRWSRPGAMERLKRWRSIGAPTNSPRVWGSRRTLPCCGHWRSPRSHILTFSKRTTWVIRCSAWRSVMATRFCSLRRTTCWA